MAETSLAQSLVDAAAEAIDSEIEALPHARRLYPDLYAKQVAKPVAARVLEALAKSERTFGVGTLEDLAAQVRESPCP